MNWLKSKPKINKGLVYKTIDDNTIIIAQDNKQSMKEKISILNNTGTCIWQLINKQMSVLQIENRLLEQFDIDKTKIKKEMDIFLSKLLKENLITLSNK